jgi:Protein of unknown function (DUF1186)/SEC-C motif
MDPAAILNQLTHRTGLPRAALQAASAQRAEIVPVFLREIDSYLARDPAERDEPTPLFFIFHLLGEWRETSAYRPLARLLRCPPDDLDALLGDAITATSHRVMAAVFDGDPRPLYEIILDRNADEYIRARMCEALALLVLRGDVDRAPIARFLRDAYMELPQMRCVVWQGWQSAIATLGLSELKSLVKRAFARGHIDRGWLDFADFEADLEQGISLPGAPRHPEDREYTPFGDTIEELSQWQGFSNEFAEPEQKRKAAEAAFAAAEPFRNPFRGVGRNAACPCGSGRKFKNCCLDR